ncbi:MAG: GDSL-type esterase/lipase family protein, partial [Clostridia bacterium]
ALSSVINNAFNKSESVYTTNSWDNFTSTLAKARSIYAYKTNDPKLAAVAKKDAADIYQKLIDATYTLQRKDNRSLKTKIAFVGDSTTYGYSLPDATRESSCFTGLIAAKYGTINYQARNFGASGCTLTKNGDFPYTTSNAYKESLKYLPDVVVIMLGTNDSKGKNFDNGKIDKFKADAIDLINSYKLLESQPVIIFNTSPIVVEIGLPSSDNKILNSNITKIAEIQREVAKESKVYSIDINKDTKNFTAADFESTDGIHPNVQGHKKLADIIYTELIEGIKGTVALDQHLILTMTEFVDPKVMTAEGYQLYSDARADLERSALDAKSDVQQVRAARVTFDKVYDGLGKYLKTDVIRIACVGDSLTEGGYPALLQNKINAGSLSFKYAVSNFGATGTTMQPCEIGYPQHEKYRKGLGNLPNIVIIMLGTNDGGGMAEDSPNFLKASKDIVDSFNALPSKPKIVFATSPRAFAKGGITQKVVDNININVVNTQKHFAAANNLPLIDINEATKNSGNLCGDGFHYSNYQVFANAFYDGLISNNIIR